MNYWLILTALAASFLLALLLAPWILPWLRKLKCSQSILEIGPSWHKETKEGTPTIGGLIFIIPTLLVTLILSISEVIKGDYRLLMCVGFVTLCGAVGFLDDYIKVVKKRNKGLSVMQKTLPLMLLIALFLGGLYTTNMISDAIFIPYLNIRIHLYYFYFLVMIPFLFFFVNSVNLTDGLDGLVTGVSLPYVISFIVVGFFFSKGNNNTGMTVFAAALVGSLLAFLIYNFHPAKVFMGDTGSLFLGAAVVALAMAYDMPYFILIGGIMYLIEGVSVVLQVGYYKLTHGKRLFKMSPIHHHFEMCGWSEVKIVSVFTAISALGCLLALWGMFYYRYFNV
ncbi:MAG: phospho-N-acetylmuramoyl-pentapeptide-transferase [Clostridia bacterium]|nr:phospho-N-acetylmuramoyl-pentapeptide-transferase [Clostridia bacterium]